MKIVADESVDFPIITDLRVAGHDVLAVVELAPGIDDDAVLQLANEQDALLLTADKDFGELVYRLRRIHRGVVLVRLAGVAPRQKGLLVVQVIDERGSDLVHAFTVISQHSVRLRRR